MSTWSSEHSLDPTSLQTAKIDGHCECEMCGDVRPSSIQTLNVWWTERSSLKTTWRTEAPTVPGLPRLPGLPLTETPPPRCGHVDPAAVRTRLRPQQNLSKQKPRRVFKDSPIAAAFCGAVTPGALQSGNPDPCRPACRSELRWHDRPRYRPRYQVVTQEKRTVGTTQRPHIMTQRLSTCLRWIPGAGGLCAPMRKHELILWVWISHGWSFGTWGSGNLRKYLRGTKRKTNSQEKNDHIHTKTWSMPPINLSAMSHLTWSTHPNTSKSVGLRDEQACAFGCFNPEIG